MPGSSTDHAPVRWDGTGGDSLLDTNNLTISDDGNAAWTNATLPINIAGGWNPAILIGGSVSPSGSMNIISCTPTVTPSTNIAALNGMNFFPILGSTSNNITDIACANLWCLGTAYTGSASTLKGASVYFILSNGSFGTVAGLDVDFNFSSSASVTDAYGVRVQDSGTANITNMYGIYVAEQTNASNPYEIWVAGAGGLYFREATNFIHSSGTGVLDLTAETSIVLNDATDGTAITFDVGNSTMAFSQVGAERGTITFADDDNTVIGITSGYFSFYNDVTNFWLGVSADRRLYFNYNAGETYANFGSGGGTDDACHIELQGELRMQGQLAELNKTRYTGFKRNATAPALSFIWVLPAEDGNAGQSLATDGSDNLQWIDPSSNWTAVNQASHGFSTGDAIYYNGSNWALAQADDVTTLAVALADVIDANNFNAVFSGEITGLSSLTAGEYYFTSSSVAGEITGTEPAISNPILYALTTTSGLVLSWRPYQNNTGPGLSQLAIKTTTSSTYNVLSQDNVILCDCSSNAITVNLPAAASSTNRELNIKKIDSTGNAVTVDGDSTDTIDGQLTKIISSQWSNMQLVCDGSGWYIL